MSRGFNPRAREGRDARVLGVTHVPVVSIHAPVKGATRCDLWNGNGCKSFNPRAREGRDIAELAERDMGIMFQSTRP